MHSERSASHCVAIVLRGDVFAVDNRDLVNAFIVAPKQHDTVRSECLERLWRFMTVD